MQSWSVTCYYKRFFSIICCNKHNTQYMFIKPVGKHRLVLNVYAILSVSKEAEIQSVLRAALLDLESAASQEAVKTQGNASSCACVGYNCGCCLHLEFEKVGLNDTGS